MKKILIVGASSEIAMACARRWIDVESDGVEFFLLGRSQAKLDTCCEDLVARGAGSVQVATFDLAAIDAYANKLENALLSLGQIDVAFIAYGSLPVQEACDGNLAQTANEVFVNATSVICMLSALGDLMREKDMSGSSLAVITSVAGERGRESNYLYGASKAAVSTYCAGLRVRLEKSGVHLTDIRPGMVDTVMTQGMDLPQPLLAKPAEVAQVIVEAIAKRKGVAYAPKYWRWVMLVIRSIPGFIFKRLGL